MEGVKFTVDLGWLVAVVIVPVGIWFLRQFAKVQDRIETLHGRITSEAKAGTAEHGRLLERINQAEKDFAAAAQAIRQQTDANMEHLRDALAAFKVEVARTYPSEERLRDLETRIVSRLDRIENLVRGASVAGVKGD